MIEHSFVFSIMRRQRKYGNMQLSGSKNINQQNFSQVIIIDTGALALYLARVCYRKLFVE